MGFGRKKTATAVAYCKRGKGMIEVNGRPLELVEPRALQFKLQEPILLLGKDRFADIDIRIRVKGGGHTSQVYAIRQALSNSLVAYYQKYVDEQSKQEIKDILVQFDRSLLVADPRRNEPKKFGGLELELDTRNPTVNLLYFAVLTSTLIIALSWNILARSTRTTSEMTV